MPRDVLMPAQPFLAVAAAGEAGRAPQPGTPHVPSSLRLSPQECGLLRKGTVLLAEQRHLPWGATTFWSTCAGAAASVLLGSYLGASKVVDGLEKKVVYKGPAPAPALSPAQGPATPGPGGRRPQRWASLRAAAPRQPLQLQAVRWPARARPAPLPEVGAGHLKAAACEDQLGRQWL